VVAAWTLRAGCSTTWTTSVFAARLEPAGKELEHRPGDLERTRGQLSTSRLEAGVHYGGRTKQRDSLAEVED
jgi:hypothetical protein